MEVILDTNFILSCIRKRIDFISQLQELGFKIVVPKEVFQEIKDLRVNDKTSQRDRSSASVALELLENSPVKKISLGGRNVDEGLIAKGREGVYIATLDRAVKRVIQNKIIIMSAKRKIVVERG